MNVILNEKEYSLLAASPTSEALTLVIAQYPDLDELVSDCEIQAMIGEFVVADSEKTRVYRGFEKVDKMSVDVLSHTVTVTFKQVYNDSAALIAIVGERVSVATAEEKREEIELLAAFADDETADKHAWAFPVWASDTVYEVGQRVQYAGLLYKCVQAHTSQADWTPDAAVSLWARTSDPGEEWPAWIQPLGSEDAYHLGDKVSHVEKHWISTADNNIWEPGVYGWEEVE